MAPILQCEMLSVLKDGVSQVLTVSMEAQPNHTAETQLDCLANRLMELRKISEDVPSVGAHGDAAVLALSSVRVVLGDHASDVGLRVKTLNKGKKEFMMKTQGELAWTELTEIEQKVRVEKEEDAFREAFTRTHPGQDLWDSHSYLEKEAFLFTDEVDFKEDALRKLGEEKYAELTTYAQDHLWNK